MAFVATDDPPSLSLVDLLSFTLKGRVRLPALATRLLSHPDPSEALVYALVPKTFSIQEVAASGQLTRSVRLAAEPLLARTRNGTLWCLLGGPAPQLQPVDLKTLRPGRGLALPALPVALDLSPSAPLAAISLSNGSLVLADLEAHKLLGALPISSELGPLSFRLDGKILTVADRARRLLVAVEPQSRRVVTELPLALSPDRFCVKSDGGQLFLTGEGRDAVVIAYPYRTEIAQTSLSGRKPGAMACSESPDFLFVANPGADSVTIFDINSQRVVALVAVGREPAAIAVTPDQQYALVLNHGSGDMGVIRIAAIAPGRAKQAPLFTMLPVGARPSTLLVRPA